MVKKRTLEDKNPYLIKSKNGRGYSSNEDKIARHLITKYNFKTIYGKKSDELYCFDSRIYTTEKARQIIKTEIETLVNKYSKNQVVNEVFEKIKRLTAMDREKFDNLPLNLIPLENGIYDLDQSILIKHSPRFNFRFIIPLVYDKKAACPNFIKFLEETLYESDIPLIQEWFGFNLYRRYFIKKAAIFTGDKDTGKTILANVLTKFIGEKNISGINLQRISNEDTFALAALYLKHSNIYDDLSSKDIQNNGGFKIATGGGYITAEYKFGDSFQYLNFAKLLFACNIIPQIREKEDGAYYGRWLIVEFINQVLEDKQDKFLLDKLTTKEELSGILNWALEGLRRLLKNGKFTYEKSTEEVKRIMDKSGSSLAKFAGEVLIEKEDGRISKEQMFEIYTIWAKKKNASRFSKEQLGRNLEKNVAYILAKNDSKERYWDHVGLNEDLIKTTWDKDTLDTFKNIIRPMEYNLSDNIYMISQKVSNPSFPDQIPSLADKKEAVDEDYLTE